MLPPLQWVAKRKAASAAGLRWLRVRCAAGICKARQLHVCNLVRGSGTCAVRWSRCRLCFEGSHSSRLNYCVAQTAWATSPRHTRATLRSRRVDVSRWCLCALLSAWSCFRQAGLAAFFCCAQGEAEAGVGRGQTRSSLGWLGGGVVRSKPCAHGCEGECEGTELRG